MTLRVKALSALLTALLTVTGLSTFIVADPAHASDWSFSSGSTTAPAVLPLTDPMELQFTFTDSMLDVALPLHNFTGNIDWGDSTWNQTDYDGSGDGYTGVGASWFSSTDMPNHHYEDETPGHTITVKIYGLAERFGGYPGSGNDVWPAVQNLTAVTQWGDLEISDFGEAFNNATSLTEVPSTLVSSARSLGSMFAGATAFNDDVSHWDTSAIENMIYMFDGATSFNQNLTTDLVTHAWDVSHVTFMNGMFRRATAFNGDISNWDVSSVWDANEMFMGAKAFNRDIHRWTTGNIHDMNHMFASAWDNDCECLIGGMTFNQPIGSWDVSHATSLASMFEGNTAFNQPLDRWTLSAADNLAGLFHGASSFDQDISRWDTSHVRDMSDMFSGAEIMTPDGGDSDTVVSTFNPHIENWDVHNVRAFWNTFGSNVSFNRNISGWHTDNVVDMSLMFCNATAFNQPIGSWHTDKVEDMTSMFQNATSFNQDLGAWHTHAVTWMRYMFYGATSFGSSIAGVAPTWNLNRWDTSHVTNTQSMFLGASSFNQDISRWDTSHVTNMAWMFDSATSFNQDISGWDTHRVTDIRAMFSGASSFNQPIGNWDISHISDIGWMFNSATAFNQDLSAWDFSHVTRADGAFSSSGLSRLNFSKILRRWAHTAHDVTSNPWTIGVDNLQYLSTVAGDVQTLADKGWTLDLGEVGGSWSAVTPNLISSPHAGDITEGQPLSESMLSGGFASVPGAFTFTNPATVLTPGHQTASVTFTPTDSISYESITLTVNIEVANLPLAPVRLTSPAISGTTQVSKTLIVSAGTWRGYPAVSLSYQWYRCTKAVAEDLRSPASASKCTAISRATGVRYKLMTADKGKYVSVVVKARNMIGVATTTTASTGKVK